MVVKNPNSKRDAARRKNANCWSELPSDLIHSFFQRLSFRDFQEAKSVCSSWYSASKQCFPKNEIPWMILFPYHRNNRCKVLNPEEKENKVYITRDLGSDISHSMCVATYGCWLLMQNHLFNLYILNVLNGHRINLPPLETEFGMVKFERLVYYRYRGFTANSFVFWIEEETKDYLVMWSIRKRYLIICKKGDNLWRRIPECSGIVECCDMVYKDQKLYVYCNDGTIRISDFSGETRPFIVQETKIVVTVSGHVLMVSRIMDIWKTWSIRIYGMKSSTNKWEKVDSLGDEALLLDMGITVLAKDIDGINRNSIYFSGVGPDEYDIFILDLETGKIQRPFLSLLPFLEYSVARWFFPSFSHK